MDVTVEMKQIVKIKVAGNQFGVLQTFLDNSANPRSMPWEWEPVSFTNRILCIEEKKTGS